MAQENESKIVYTTAPAAYDYSYVTELETWEETPSYGGIPLKWRKVRLDTTPYRIEYQCNRYRSGNNAVREDDPREQ